MDEEKAINKYNKKHQLKNKIFEDLRRKDKGYSYLNQPNQSINDRVYLDDYEKDIVNSESDEDEHVNNDKSDEDMY